MNFEYVILKNILTNKSYFNKVKSILKPEIFDSYANTKIYKIIDDFYEKYKDVPNIQEIALQIKDIPEKELRNQIAEALNEIKNSENINKDFLDDETIKFVKNQMFTRALMLGAEFIDKKDENAKLKAKELIDESQLISIHNDLGTIYDNIEERIDYYQNPQKGIKFLRYKTLNDCIGEGFLKGTLNLFLSAAGVGKSLLTSTSIADFLLQQKNILLVSLEMSNLEFLKRIDADLLDLPINDLKNIDANVIRQKFKELKVGKLFVQNYPAGSFSANDLASLIEMYKLNGINFDIIFIDYLGLMKSTRVSPNVGLYSYIKSIGEEVRAKAVEYQVTIFSASQLNRSSINSTDSNNEAISDSMGTAMTADFMMFLLQNEEMKSRSVIKFKITKNRYSGKTISFDMNIDYQKMRIEETSNNVIKREISEIENMSSEELKKLGNQNNSLNINWNF